MNIYSDSKLFEDIGLWFPDLGNFEAVKSLLRTTGLMEIYTTFYKKINAAAKAGRSDFIFDCLDLEKEIMATLIKSDVKKDRDGKWIIDSTTMQRIMSLDKLRVLLRKVATGKLATRSEILDKKRHAILRSHWYSYYKGAWAKVDGIHIGTSESDVGWEETRTQLYSDINKEFVTAKIISYEDMLVWDKTRMRSIFTPFIPSTVTGNKVVVISIEKDDAHPVIEHFSEHNGFYVISTRGQPGFASSEVIKLTVEARLGKKAEDLEWYVVGLNDLDYTGFTITGSFVQQLSDLGCNVKDWWIVDWWKILTEQEKYEMAYPIKSSARKGKEAEKWMWEYGIPAKDRPDDMPLFGIEINSTFMELRERFLEYVARFCVTVGVINEKEYYDYFRNQNAVDLGDVVNKRTNKLLETHPIKKKIAELRKLIRDLEAKLEPIKTKIIALLTPHAQSIVDKPDFDDVPDPSEGSFLNSLSKGNNTFAHPFTEEHLDTRLDNFLVEDINAKVIDGLEEAMKFEDEDKTKKDEDKKSE